MFIAQLLDQPNHKEAFLNATAMWGDPLAYEQSWLYIYQATRKGGWYYSDSDGWLAVACNYLGEDRHAAIVPLSKDLSTFIPRAIKALQASGIRIELVKHVPTDIVNALGKTGLFSLLRQPKSFQRELFLEQLSEDRLPQVIVNLSTGWADNPDGCKAILPTLPTGHGMQDFRYQLKRFCRKHVTDEHAVTVTPLTCINESECKVAVDNWMTSIIDRFSRPGHPRVADFDSCFRQPIESLLHLVWRHKDAGCGYIISADGVPSAGWVGSYISQTCFGIYVLFADTRIHNLSDYTLYHAMQYARLRNAKFVNLGGSELESLFRFKHKVAKDKNQQTQMLRRVVDLQVVK